MLHTSSCANIVFICVLTSFLQTAIKSPSTTGAPEKEIFPVLGPENNQTDPEILCSHTLIVMGNFNGNVLAQKKSSKSQKNRTSKHYRLQDPEFEVGRWYSKQCTFIQGMDRPWQVARRWAYTQPQLVNDPGNPRVKITDPYSYPRRSIPVTQGYGYWGVWVRGTTGTTGQKLCTGVLTNSNVVTTY